MQSEFERHYTRVRKHEKDNYYDQLDHDALLYSAQLCEAGAPQGLRLQPLHAVVQES